MNALKAPESAGTDSALMHAKTSGVAAEQPLKWISKDVAKAKRAVGHPRRPGGKCRANPGVFRPEVDAKRCEGKGECVAACPYQVFKVGRLTDSAINAMPLLAKLRLWAHGFKTAYTPNADACRACGLCVVACPERAIRLVGPVADGE